MLVERINEVQRVLLTGGIHPFIRKTTLGVRSKAPATSFLSHAGLGGVHGQRAAQSRRPPVSELSTCAHTHAGPRTPVSPHVCTPVGRFCAPALLRFRRSPTAVQHLGQVAHDGAVFAAVQVELPGEEGEVDIQCQQVPTRLQGQRVLEEGQVDELALGAST